MEKRYQLTKAVLSLCEAYMDEKIDECNVPNALLGIVYCNLTWEGKERNNG